MPRDANRPTRKWPWITLAILVVLAGAGCVFYFVNDGQGTTATEQPPKSNVSQSSEPATSVEPTGCLGGESRDASMAISAASAAPHNTEGAVELSASFVRWIQRYPYPTAAEASAVSDALLAKISFTDDLRSYLAAQPDLSGGIVPQGTNYWMTTVAGVWQVEQESPDRVQASIGTAFVIDGGLSPTLRSSIAVTVVWESGGWKISAADGTRTTQDLFAVGQPFTNGC